MRPFVQLLGVLLLVGFVLHYIWWIVAAGAIYAAWRYGWPQAQQWMRNRDAQAARRRADLNAIAARADQQHNWALQGDPRGTYGEPGASGC